MVFTCELELANGKKVITECTSTWVSDGLYCLYSAITQCIEKYPLTKIERITEQVKSSDLSLIPC